MTNELHPWERRADETGSAWEAFKHYRSQTGRRTCTATAKKFNKTVDLIRRWSAQYSWIHRCLEYDRHLDRVAHDAHIAEIQAMKRRQAQEGMLLQSKGSKAIDLKDPQEIDTGDATRMIKTGVDIERVARGEPDTVQETRLTDVDSALDREIGRVLADPRLRSELDRVFAGVFDNAIEPGEPGPALHEGEMEETETPGTD